MKFIVFQGNSTKSDSPDSQIKQIHQKWMTADAIQCTVEAKKAEDQTVGGLAERAEDISSLEAIACSLDTPDDCLSGGS